MQTSAVTPTETMKPFSRLHGDPDGAARIYERNYINQFEYEFKPITKTRYSQKAYQENWAEKNLKTAKGRFYDYKQDGVREHMNYRTSYNEAGNAPVDHNAPMNLRNLQTIKRKEFNKQNLRSELPQGRIVDKEAFAEEGNLGSSMVGSASKIPRTNLFLSKQHMKLNKDFHEQPLIRNVQIVSEDTPGFFQNTSSFYTVENMDLTKKHRNNMKNLPKSDLFGNLVVNYPTPPDNLIMEPPHHGLRYERSRMIPVEKKRKDEVHLESKDMKWGTMKIEWKEFPQTQKYDRLNFEKIGSLERPFIKRLEQARSTSQQPHKIGMPEVPHLDRKLMPLQIKIGHPESMVEVRRK
eukprot:TRINITY_DN5486_c0_g1_i15.p1 TRINITY_DN5486_c0_g1~~TRINITY_DN5486_c0_g1_i15.p1  ORF type:complete len:351 (-),score=63.58 TRINITY_DN5486_c0_g1_i15:162-1214(-)